jgi:serine-type D-Ala-D-Ala carboxypeptidase/endopeptidase (penicillin-binding protein 4)
MHKIILVSLIGLSSFLCSQNQLIDAKNNLLSDLQLKNASIGLCVMDVKTGEIITENQQFTSIPTASTVKLFATATAIEILGANYKPQTRIYASHKMNENGVIDGDLFIRGGGDVSLGSRYFNTEGKENDFLKKWADTLYALGVRKIKGDVIGDGSEFGYQGAPDGWNWADLGNYYGAGPSGLPIYDNLLRYYFKVAGTLGSKAELISMFPQVENLNFTSYIIGSKSKGDNSYIYGAPYSLDRFGTGSLPIKSKQFMVKSTLPDPELQFAKELYQALKNRGIEIGGSAKNARLLQLASARFRYNSSMQLLFTHVGASVSSIAYWTNMKSVNLFAEQLVCWVGYSKVGDGSISTSLRHLNGYWNQRINTSGLYITDGSGLSRTNAVSPRHFCDLLKHMATSKNNEAFKATLPVSGESGTLSKVCYKQAAHGKIKAKSGTMRRIKSYAGYAQTYSGRELTFAIILNNYNCSNEAALAKIEKFMNAMVQVE